MNSLVKKYKSKRYWKNKTKYQETKAIIEYLKELIQFYWDKNNYMSN